MMYQKCATPRQHTQRATRRPGYRPAVNIQKSESDFHIDFALPGWKREEITLEMDEGKLLVKGAPQKEDEGEYKYTYRRFGKPAFERSFALGKAIDVEGISAKFENGILRIQLPVKAKVNQTIAIK